MKTFSFPKSFKKDSKIYYKVTDEKKLKTMNERLYDFENITESTIVGHRTVGYVNYHLYYVKKDVVIEPELIDEFDLMLIGSLVKEGIV